MKSHTPNSDDPTDEQTTNELTMLDDLADALYEVEYASALDDEAIEELTGYRPIDYESVFGSVDLAIVELGYPPRDIDDLDRELMVRALQVFAVSRGESPSKRDFRENGPFAPARIEKEFGRWNDGLLAAGVDSLGIRVALGECLPDPDDPFTLYDSDEYASVVGVKS